MSKLRRGVLVRGCVLGLWAAGAVGCSRDALDPGGPPRVKDMVVVFGADDLAEPPPPPDPCGPDDPDCREATLGPDHGKPFPLPSDQVPDPNAAADSLARDPGGALRLDQSQTRSQYLWIAQDADDAVSKIDSRTMRELARYASYTCYSLPGGDLTACDGTRGCCAADSDPQWQHRRFNQVQGPAQGVQRASNSPSRTAVDYNGDLFISNRAFGGQASVTKIANNLSGCRDLDKNGRIDTSKDVNNDGRIDPRDPREFLGPADECILWTTNHGAANAVGRPLALAPGAVNGGASDAWAGEYYGGRFVRIDGATGKISAESKLPNGCSPYGAVIDNQGILWAAPLSTSGPLCFLDTQKPDWVGQARTPNWGAANGYGITLDRDQNVWLGLGVARYWPNRSQGFGLLGQGTWTRIGSLSGTGIAADSRSAKKYFVWSAQASAITRIPASDIPVDKKADSVVPQVTVDTWPKVTIDAYGVGIDADQNVIAVPHAKIVYRIKVDANGVAAAPDLTSPPAPGKLCPAGDRCDLGAHLYTYSDFAGFGLRNFTRPTGTYSYVFEGCKRGGGPSDTEWYSIEWAAGVPAGTAVTVRARVGNVPAVDQTWGAFSPIFSSSPADLRAGQPLNPFDAANGYLQVELKLQTTDVQATPGLSGVKVRYRCPP